MSTYHWCGEFIGSRVPATCLRMNSTPMRGINSNVLTSLPAICCASDRKAVALCGSATPTMAVSRERGLG